MSRLIDADALWKEVCRRDADDIFDITDIREFIDEAPTIEIVRCKECKAYITDRYNDGFGWCEFMEIGREYRDFCSSGKRRML